MKGHLLGVGGGKRSPAAGQPENHQDDDAGHRQPGQDGCRAQPGSVGGQDRHQASCQVTADDQRRSPGTEVPAGLGRGDPGHRRRGRRGHLEGGRVTLVRPARPEGAACLPTLRTLLEHDRSFLSDGPPLPGTGVAGARRRRRRRHRRLRRSGAADADGRPGHGTPALQPASARTFPPAGPPHTAQRTLAGRCDTVAGPPPVNEPVAAGNPAHPAPEHLPWRTDHRQRHRPGARTPVQAWLAGYPVDGLPGRRG
ncbi:hypothetical protein KCH_03740 [Kitasatospora cheerisanensis KCTC 2395]|uniref:Uncharacterized protein n=1 Tax=Kitasatospora cheerisanensis KCTC 2395 TaxID=1348663 RepID=A0A066Z2N5_9ACTN|nr:hypothetical protein KCH_03740 [Kitasatospora cheerisanensis KCTC 2395]